MLEKRMLIVAVATSLALPSLPVFGQLEEIIVTARKRQESILQVPVVATVLGQDTIEQFAAGDLYDVTERVPGLNFSRGTLSFGAQISMRGVGTSTLNTTIDQSVALNIDGMQLTHGLAYAAAMFDMAQIEVLKGPQALFFGKAAPGGVISIRSADPGDELEVIVRHGYETEADENRTDFIFSGPLTDTLGLRLAGRYSDMTGFMENAAVALAGTGAVTPDRDFPANEEWLVRGTALWYPNERFSARFKFNFNDKESNGNGGQGQLVSCPDGVDPPAGIPFIDPNEDCKFDNTLRTVWFDAAAFPPGTGFGGNGIRNNGVPFNKVEQQIGTLELNYDVTPELTLTAVTGYYDLDQSSMINGTSTGYAGAVLAADPDFDREDFTQELRLTSNFSDSSLNFMVGAFYQDATMTYYNNLLINTALYDEIEQLFGAPPGAGPSIFPPQFQKGIQPIDVESVSLFGQLLWQVTPELELAAGVRWTDEERQHKIINTNTPTGEGVVQATPTPVLTEDDYSPEFTLTWTPTDDLTVFAAYKTAFKAGSFDTVTLPNSPDIPAGEVSFGDEKVKGGEAGIKMQLLERRMLLNAAAYYYKFDDMQVGANEASAQGTVEIRTYNAASSKIRGVDFDVTYAPKAVGGLTLWGRGNYNNAEFEDFSNAQCWGGQRIQDGCDQVFNAATGRFQAQDLSGTQLLRAPEWTASAGLDYETTVADGMRLALGWYSSYSDEYFNNLLQRSDMVQDAYFTHNASIALSGRDGGWEVAVIGNNLGDELVSGNCPNANYANGVFLGGIVSGEGDRGIAGVEEVSCDVINRHAIWLRVEFRLSELFGG